VVLHGALVYQSSGSNWLLDSQDQLINIAHMANFEPVACMAELNSGTYSGIDAMSRMAQNRLRAA
jgi:hypothetical protein